jgi:hypothetical protein
MIPVHYFVKMLLVAVLMLLGVVLYAGQGASSAQAPKSAIKQVPQVDRKADVSILLPVVLL